MDATLELRHDGKRWFLDITMLDGKGTGVEICISHETKEELEKSGVPFFTADE